MEVTVECLLVNMQIMSLGTNRSHSLSTRCLSSGRRWCGKSFTNSCCENVLLVPRTAGGSFMDRCFHIPHALWVKKSPPSPLFSQVLSCQVHEGLSLHLTCARGLLATLFFRLCLLGALDLSAHTRTNANKYFFFF